MAHLLSVKDAQHLILKEFSAVEPETAPLEQALRRVLASDIISDLSFPPFSNSSMDGFAVLSQDTQSASREHPAHLKVVADIPAGAHPQVVIGAGQTARIMTGAPMPEGADAVVPVEQTSVYTEQPGSTLPGEVLIFQAAQAGAYIRRAGDDLRAGQVVLRAGRRLSPQDLGALAALGVAQAPVYRRPRVALFSSGDELIAPDQPMEPGKIRNSNTYALAALAQQAGAEVDRLGIAADSPESVRQCFDEAVASHADLILTSAGVSVGAYDFVRTIVEENGSLTFWRVNMRPGKPLAFGNYRGVPVIGLPGNPVSAFVGFLVFVQPVLQKLAGLPPLERRTLKAFLTEPIESDGRESYLRAFIRQESGKMLAALTGHQGSGNLFSLVEANALLIVPSGVKSVPVGSEVDAWILEESLLI